jgi:hypothetical protein
MRTDYLVASDEKELWSRVGPLENEEICIYYQDHDKKYEFGTNSAGRDLLLKLIPTILNLLKINAKVLQDSFEDLEQAIREGESLYTEKPHLRSVGQTWSNDEYAHPGLQRVYLKLKSFQRFVEAWCVLERAEHMGIFSGLSAVKELVVCSLGGGPGIELYSFSKFVEQRFPHVSLRLVSLDRCWEWHHYSEALGVEFSQWDVNAPGSFETIEKLGSPIDYVLIFNVLMYFNNDTIQEYLERLFERFACRAVLINERGKFCEVSSRLQRKGYGSVRLIHQGKSRDERQLALIPKPSSGSSSRSELRMTFPNVPPVDWADKVDRSKFGRPEHILRADSYKQSDPPHWKRKRASSGSRDHQHSSRRYH